ncbi:MAG: hypothetical protein JXA28_04830 [Bacteroidetes bacterium]|nr:hypothetical protein [Bacteroidota bacterium]
MFKCMIAAVSGILLLSACSEDPDTNPVIPSSTAEKHALVMVVENNEMFPTEVEFGWMLLKDQLIPIVSELFGIPGDSLRNRSFIEVIDDFGEPWIMDQITAATGTAYEEIVRLSDRDATVERMLAELDRLRGEGYRLDLLLDMHASTTVVCFDDRDVPVMEMTQAVKSRNLPIRVLYQTCCHASHHLAAWEATGVIAACGSYEANSLTIYSPIGFAKYWSEGYPFAEAVRRATGYEIEQTRALDQQFPLPFGYKMEPTEEDLRSSYMILAGRDTLVTFDIAL